MNILDIANGHIKNIFNLNEDMSNNRLKICYACPLYSTKMGGICNNKLWLNVNTGDVSNEKKKDYKRGCGCILSAKTRLANATCPLGKW